MGRDCALKTVRRHRATGVARERAVSAVQRMGYELHVARAEIQAAGGKLAVSLTVTNTCVAPFYYDWPVELAAQSAANERVVTWQTDWLLSTIVPGEAAAPWRFTLSVGRIAISRPLPARPANGEEGSQTICASASVENVTLCLPMPACISWLLHWRGY